ncbi:MAG: HD-GYP domain-containing protein (c-di-GMP phosphodiesterase class II) [Flavobacteriales bacterium]|jgi:HD-GYP domain-containing protein (c-di-GMP phosphodiesterase class II)/HPt (histidine-containing phosphotransfer) domain-containing protein
MSIDDLDPELRDDLMSSFDELYLEIESCLCRLEQGFDERIVNELFRGIHSIKGNAGMVHIPIIVDYAHQIEHVVSCVREGALALSAPLCEALQVGMDRLRDLHYREVLDEEFANLDSIMLGAKFAALAQCGNDGAARWIAVILGLRDDLDPKAPEQAIHYDAQTSDVTIANGQVASESELVDHLEEQSATFGRQDDLLFFQELALQVDTQNQYWSGRSIQLFEWSLKLNQMGGDVVGYEQLAAAIYLHDIGMLFIPNEILNKEGKLTDDELMRIRLHPSWGYSILSRMSGWDEAAQIVLQHHEHENGNGYPSGLSGDAIHVGAKILALVDAFFSMTNGRADRSTRRTALRAISEINARKGTQFNAYWVDCFNEMIKKEVRQGTL